MHQRSPTAGQALIERHDSADIETVPPPKFTMKTILLFAAMATLLTTTGCLVAEDGRGGGRHEHYEGRSEVIVGPPIVAVRAPEVIVR